ncbi:hypothetical protein Patl1_35397 [Pistacia atlantica]|nr:hypothetical protein Patl1_35397 [Pistacia atlantica]
MAESGAPQTRLKDLKDVAEIRDVSTPPSPAKSNVVPSSFALRLQNPYVQPQRGPKINLQKYDGEEEPTDWSAFVHALEKRFGPSDFDDPEGELAKLRQNSLVAAYQKRFEALSNRVGGLTDEFLLHCFVSGLKDEIRYMLKLQQPTSLKEAIGLTRTQEAHLAARPRNLNSSCLNVKAPPPPNAIVMQGSSFSTQFSTPIKNISYEAMKERRDKDEDMDCSDDPPSLDNNAPEISLHAMTGAPTPQTMRVTGLLGRQVISILIVIGSTHNFLDPHLANKAGLSVDTNATFDVMVANGDKLPSTGRSTNAALTIQGTLIHVDFYLLSLDGCDALLGWPA